MIKEVVGAFGNMYLNRYSLDFPPGGPRESRPYKGGRREPAEAAGSAVTFARECAKQNLNTLLIGSIGDDAEGRMLSSLLSGHKYLNTVLITTPDAQTEIGHHFITTDKGDYRVHDGDANEHLTPKVIYDELQRRSSLLYVYSGGVLKQPHMLSQLPDLFFEIRKLGINVLLDHGNVPIMDPIICTKVID